MDIIYTVQKYIISALRQNEKIMQTAQIYTYIPFNAPYPYIRIADYTVEPINLITGQASKLKLDVQIYSDDRSPKQCWELMEEISISLDNLTFKTSSYKLLPMHIKKQSVTQVSMEVSMVWKSIINFETFFSRTLRWLNLQSYRVRLIFIWLPKRSR